MAHQKFEDERTLMRIHIRESNKVARQTFASGNGGGAAQREFFRRYGLARSRRLRLVQRYHTDKILRLSQDLPIVLEVIESQERIDQILPHLDEMVDGGLITLERVRVILYRPASK
jgi:hypothetical protein